MPTIIQKKIPEVLRHIIRQMLVEKLIVEADDESQSLPTSTFKAGEEFDALEKAAKERYEAAQAELKAWDENEKRRVNFPAAVDALRASKKISKDNARKELMSNPATRYDVKLAQTKRPTLEKQLAKAETEYAEYNPELRGYVRARSGGAKTAADKVMPPNGKAVRLSIDSVKPLRWYAWPPIGSSKLIYHDANDKNVGPGEQWLAWLFGGQVQGGGVPFDVVTPDGRIWEVKELKKSSDTIRPGTEGRKAFKRAKKRLEGIVQQLRNFSILARRSGFLQPGELDETDKRIVDYVNVFVEDDYEMIVGKGEISRDRFIALRGVLKALQQFRQKHGNQTSMEDQPDTRVALNDKEVKVDKPTFIDVAKKVEKSTGTKNILADFEKIDLLLSTLKDPAFENPAEFFNEWFLSVDVNEVFSETDGVIVVNPRGFMMIPKSMLKKALRFDKVTQMQPRFALTLPHN
jgi:hypothetical protein